MGLLSTLGKIASIAGPIAAVPFTGGTSLLGLTGMGAGTAAGVAGALGAAGNIMGNAAGSKSDQRMQQGALINQANQNLLDRYRSQQDAEMQAGRLDLDRKLFSEDARSGRARQAGLADVLLNFKPTSIDVPGIRTANISGGLAGAIGGPGFQQAMQTLREKALLAQLTPDEFTGGRMIAPPQLEGLPRASTMERILELGGLGGSLAGGIGEALNRVARLPQVPSVPAYAGLPGVMPGADVGMPQIPRPPVPQAAVNFNPDIWPNVRF